MPVVLPQQSNRWRPAPPMSIAERQPSGTDCSIFKLLKWMFLPNTVLRFGHQPHHYVNAPRILDSITTAHTAFGAQPLRTRATIIVHNCQDRLVRCGDTRCIMRTCAFRAVDRYTGRGLPGGESGSLFRRPVASHLGKIEIKRTAFNRGHRIFLDGRIMGASLRCHLSGSDAPRTRATSVKSRD